MSPLTLFVPLFFIGTMIKGKSKKAGAIYDILWSAGILIWALGVYAEGNTVALFGSVELPQPVFILIILGIMASEVAALVQASKAQPEIALKQQEEAAVEAAAIKAADAVATHLDRPCTLYIVHTRGIIGTAAKIQLTLNGRFADTLSNSSYLVLSTDRRENLLRATCQTMPNGVELTFDALSGGELRVDLGVWSTKGIRMSLADTVAYRQPRPGKKRVRKLKLGYVLWSLSNIWAYFLGIVPMILTFGAAKTPFDDVAARKLRTAKKWNLWMSGILLLGMITITGLRLL